MLFRPLACPFSLDQRLPDRRLNGASGYGVRWRLGGRLARTWRFIGQCDKASSRGSAFWLTSVPVACVYGRLDALPGEYAIASSLEATQITHFGHRVFACDRASSFASAKKCAPAATATHRPKKKAHPRVLRRNQRRSFTRSPKALRDGAECGAVRSGRGTGPEARRREDSLCWNLSDRVSSQTECLRVAAAACTRPMRRMAINDGERKYPGARKYSPCLLNWVGGWRTNAIGARHSKLLLNSFKRRIFTCESLLD